MGLSASQARLLSITSRLSDNELRSQTITTAKMSLANRTTQASAEYMDALSSTNLLFTTYDGSGNKVTEKLTGTSLSLYGPLKNQYGLINKSGQILVSELDATNYENSANMEEFLDKYGVLSPVGEGDFVQVINPDYEVAWDEYNKIYEEWKSREPQKSDPIYQIEDPNWVPGVPGEGDDEVETWSLYEAFMEGTAGGCFSCSSNPSSTEYNIVRHFNHTLGHMLVGGAPDIWAGSLWWDKPVGGLNGTSGDGRIMSLIAEAIVGKTCCGKSGCEDGPHEHNFYGTDVTFDCGHENCDGTQLITDKIRNLMQDIAAYANNDLNKVGDDSDPTWVALKKRYYHLIEHDLKGVIGDIQIPKDPEPEPEPPIIFNEPGWQEDYDAWLEQEPEQPDVPYYLEEEVRKIVDKDKGQWYVNLWHRMNGESDIKAGTTDQDGNIVEGGKTKSGLPMYKVLEDGLMNSSEWLQSALNNGTITLERVDFTDPTEEGTGLADCTWTSIIWTSSSDITEEENEAAITAAEVQYEQALRDIEAKDKQYDNQLKILDTEHNALQTEYDSVKSVIEKTIERNLKLYS